MKRHLCPSFIASCLFMLLIVGLQAKAQQKEDTVLIKLTALRNDYTSKITAFGYAFNRKVPEIVMNNPRSFGNYDDSTNVIQTSDWKTTPKEIQDFFSKLAAGMDPGISGQVFFELAVHRWIYIHELGHWWRACQNVTADPYENEKAANRIASAYWKETDPKFYDFMLRYFKAALLHNASPVPPGQSKEQYLKNNYDKLPGGSAYTWYQAMMIVEVSKEKPFESFKQAIQLSGRPLQ